MGKWIFNKDERKKFCIACLEEIFDTKLEDENFNKTDDEIHFTICLGGIIGVECLYGKSRLEYFYDNMVDEFVKECKGVADINYIGFKNFYSDRLIDFMLVSLRQEFYDLYGTEYNGDIFTDMIELRKDLATEIFVNQFNKEEYHVDTVRKFIVRKYHQEPVQ